MATKRKGSAASLFGRRADGTIRPRFWLDCRGRMHAAAGPAASSAPRKPARPRKRKPAPPRPTAAQRRAVARYEAAQRQGRLL